MYQFNNISIFQPNQWLSRALLIAALISLGACTGRQVRPLDKSYTMISDNSSRSALERSVLRQLSEQGTKTGYYFIETGVEAFSALSGLISSAERSIDLQSFIYHDDRTGKLLAYKLMQAADRGVRVRILLDDFFSSSKALLLGTLNAHRNIEVRFFNPVSTVSWARPLALITRFKKVTRRMHNKAFIVDNRVAIIGGRNVGDVYFSMHKDYQFTDLDVLSVGPMVNKISGSFDVFWNSRWVVGVESYQQFNNNSTQQFVKLKFAQLKKNAASLMRSSFMLAVKKTGIATRLTQGRLPLLWSESTLFFDPPVKVKGKRKYRDQYLMRQIIPYLSQAKSEILIITPYFVPRLTGLRWIKKLRKKGVRIVVLTNSFASNDIPLAYIGYERYRQKLLKLGVELYEFKPSAESKRRKAYTWLKHTPKAGLHSKLIIIDGKKIIIGSPNLNARSRNLDTEIALLIKSKEISKRMSILFGKLVKPENSYRVLLRKRQDQWAEVDEPDDDNEQLIWLTQRKGKLVRYRSEPKTKVFKHMAFSIFGLLPIEGLL